MRRGPYKSPHESVGICKLELVKLSLIEQFLDVLLLSLFVFGCVERAGINWLHLKDSVPPDAVARDLLRGDGGVAEQ